MKIFTSKTQQTGEIGETAVAKNLVKQGFRIIDRNYTRKWGEIDIVAKKGNVIHFIEVKSITVRDMFSHETSFYRPEENMSSLKLTRLRRVISTYITEKNFSDSQEWQFDLACVYLRLKQTSSKVCSPEHPDGQDVLGGVELLKVEWVLDIIL
jgi:putative endonuclease